MLLQIGHDPWKWNLLRPRCPSRHSANLARRFTCVTSLGEGNGQASHDHTIHRNGGRGTKGTPGLAAHSLGEVNFGCWKVGKCFGKSMCSADTMEHWSKKSSIDHLVRDTSPVRASGASSSSVSLSQNLLAVM